MTPDDLAAEKYLSLATYKRDGTRVATPVWVAGEGEHLYVITDGSSGKAKRLRNSSRAQVAPCDSRGTVTGPVTDATAELLDAAGTAHVKALIDAKYGLVGKAFGALAAVRRTVRRTQEDTVGIRISLRRSVD